MDRERRDRAENIMVIIIFNIIVNLKRKIGGSVINLNGERKTGEYIECECWGYSSIF